MKIDGLLVVDKPEGLSSLDVVREVKRRFGIRKAGHLGTLDPFATGVLPIVINEGTKLAPFVQEEPKEYEATLSLGEETNTDDLTGKVTGRKPLEGITAETIDAAFRFFTGKILQVPPMFSAIKINGRPLYELARRGVEVERKEREVTIFRVRVEKITPPQVAFTVSCSRGTYIRTLARDIGRKIGCGAHLVSLRRLRSGLFTLERAISWMKLRAMSSGQELQPWITPLEQALPGLVEVNADARLVKKVRLGNEMATQDFSSDLLPVFEKGEWVKLTSPEEGLIAILRPEVRSVDLRQAGRSRIALRPLRVFHSSKYLA